jgi:hypothetical protein
MPQTVTVLKVSLRFNGVVGDKVPYHMGCTGGGVLAGFQIFLKFYLRYLLFFFKF